MTKVESEQCKSRLSIDSAQIDRRGTEKRFFIKFCFVTEMRVW